MGSDVVQKILKNMSDKKINDLSELGNFVFSTNKHIDLNTAEQEQTLAPAQQNLRAVFSKKGRGGKIVTIIKGFVGTDADLKKIAKTLKTRCGVGGSVKNKEIIIQGNYREAIINLLQKQGFKVKRVGG